MCVCVGGGGEEKGDRDIEGGKGEREREKEGKKSLVRERLTEVERACTQATLNLLSTLKFTCGIPPFLFLSLSLLRFQSMKKSGTLVTLIDVLLRASARSRETTS